MLSEPLLALVLLIWVFNKWEQKPGAINRFIFFFQSAALKDHEICYGKGWRLCYLKWVSGVVASYLSDLLSSFPCGHCAVLC